MKKFGVETEMSRRAFLQWTVLGAGVMIAAFAVPVSTWRWLSRPRRGALPPLPTRALERDALYAPHDLAG